jgi:hypothetical protein
MGRLSAFAAVLLALAVPGAAAAKPVKAGDAVARVGAGKASLASSRITRAWRTGADGVVTTTLRGATGPDWSAERSPDFTLTVDGLKRARHAAGRSTASRRAASRATPHGRIAAAGYSSSSDTASIPRRSSRSCAPTPCAPAPPSSA